VNEDELRRLQDQSPAGSARGVSGRKDGTIAPGQLTSMIASGPAGTEAIHFRSGCHQAALFGIYRDQVLTLTCSICGKPTIKLRIC
jgi:hypothetical protein